MFKWQVGRNWRPLILGQMFPYGLFKNKWGGSVGKPTTATLLLANDPNGCNRGLPIIISGSQKEREFDCNHGSMSHRQQLSAQARGADGLTSDRKMGGLTAAALLTSYHQFQIRGAADEFQRSPDQGQGRHHGEGKRERRLGDLGHQ